MSKKAVSGRMPGKTYDEEQLKTMFESMTPLEACRIIKEHDFPVMIATMPPIPSTMNGKTEKELWEIVETALKEYKYLKLKDQEIKDYGHYSHKEFLEDRKKLKALEIIKELFNLRVYEKQGQFFICSGVNGETPISKEKADLLKEVLL